MAQHYPWLLETYDAFPENIMRADTARVLYMHRFGGAQGNYLSVILFVLLQLQTGSLCLSTCFLGPVCSLHAICLPGSRQHASWAHSQKCPNHVCMPAGLYADLDFDVMKPFDSLISGQTLLLAAMNDDEAFNHRIPNAWMASVPGHPFWFFCMQHIIAAATPCTWQPKER